MRNILLAAASIGALALSSSQPLVAQGDVDQQLGTVHFQTSCNEVAQRRFDRGMRYQHSYWYLNAKEVFEEANWMAFFGLVAPKDTPAPIVQRLSAALKQALAMPELRDRLAAQQAIVVGSSPEEFKAEIARELARFKRAVAAAKIELN